MDSGRVLKGADDRIRLGWRIGLFLLLFLALAIAGLSALAVMVPEPGFAGATLPILAAAVAAGWALLAMEGRGFGALGFHLSRTWPAEALAGLALGCGAALLTVLVIALAGGLSWSMTPWSEVTAGAFLVPALGGLWLFTLPAFAEEALFRGYPFQAMAESWGAGAALLLTSALFALVHLGNPNVTGLATMNIFAAGVFLGAIYLRTASLWWASGAHLGWNWAHGFLFAVPVSGLDLVNNPLIEASTHGPDWLSGGPFGPEGSALAALVLIAASVGVWRTRRLRPEQFGEGAMAEPPLWLERMKPGDRERSTPEAGKRGAANS